MFCLLLVGFFKGLFLILFLNLLKSQSFKLEASDIFVPSYGTVLIRFQSLVVEIWLQLQFMCWCRL